MFGSKKKRKEYGWNVEGLENEEGGQYVKLDIVEGYTGYQGRSIWGLIYGENCFKGRTFIWLIPMIS